MTLKAELVVSPELGDQISPFIFGALTEHFGRGLYGGLWDREREVPRADVMAAVQALGTTMFRYPGGCFSSWYHWRDGVGPRSQRPVHETTYWTGFHVGDADADRLAPEFGPREDNLVGTDEFLRYCIDCEIEPLLVANAGSGTAEEAAAWVRYCNQGPAPRSVRWWAVGNETYGPWEIGHCPPEEYAERFLRYRTAMREVDPSIRLIALGCGDGTEAGRAWDEIVLQRCGMDLDALSLHWYFPGPWMGRPLRDDEADQLQVAAAPDLLGAMLDEVIEVADRVVPGGNIQLSLDEWNLWGAWEDLLTANHRLGDAVFFAGCWNQLLTRAARVSHAMISHQVNCMAPIQTRGDRMFVTSSYLVAQMYRRHMKQRSVPFTLSADTVRVPPFADVREREISHTRATRVEDTQAPVVTASVTRDGSGVTVFYGNRSVAEPVLIELAGLPARSTSRVRRLAGIGPFARNEVDDPTALGFAEETVQTGPTGRVQLQIPPAATGCLVVNA